jgi:choice-of-anchor B domain-containing protein
MLEIKYLQKVPFRTFAYSYFITFVKIYLSMRFLVLFVFFQCYATGIYTQTLNTELLAHVNYQQLHNANLNDVWGYVDEAGNEYAIVGTTKGTSILDLTDPSNPFEVFWIEGAHSIWRDPCVFGDFAYVTTEAKDGLTIIDLSPLPNSTNLPTYLYQGNSESKLLSAHTCYIDEKGFAYVFGSNIGKGGVLILDVKTDPINPEQVGFFDEWYVHDGFVRNDTMYLAHILDGFVSIVDISNKANPILLGTVNTPNHFSHNVWPTNNGKVIYTTDEVTGAYIAAYDITNIQTIREIDRFQNSPGKGIVPHNTHVRGNFLITSYYSDGVIVNDITHPDNIVKIAQFDTYPGQTIGFDGNWGVYPFLPSGNLVLSDITEGLFIVHVNYEQASYLHGVIKDANSGAPIEDVQIQLKTVEQIESSHADGTYKTGVSGSGNFEVSYFKVGYLPQTVTVKLEKGVVTTKDVLMIPMTPFSLVVNVLEAETSQPISDAQIILKAPLLEYNGLTNGAGQENFTIHYKTIYTISAAKWGYMAACMESYFDEKTGSMTVLLEKGYYDDFSFDLGWNVTGTAKTGSWERGSPNPTASGSAPGKDADYDCLNKAYVTGNNPALNDDVDDVDGGITILSSPVMDLSSYDDPHLNFNYWFFCWHGNPPDDTLIIRLSNGIEAVKIAHVTANDSIFNHWNQMNIRLKDFLEPTSGMVVSFQISDLDSNVNITEAGIDYIYVSNYNMLKNSVLEMDFDCSPVPTSDFLFLECGNETAYSLTNLNGNVLFSGETVNKKATIHLSAYPPATYLLKVGNRVKRIVKT